MRVMVAPKAKQHYEVSKHPFIDRLYILNGGGRGGIAVSKEDLLRYYDFTEGSLDEL